MSKAQRGEFDFLAGEWTIRHRRRPPGAQDWDHFEGEASCRSLLQGLASIEELRIPARGFAGMGVRVLDLERDLWCDYWVSARNGVLTPAPMTGLFEGGVGTFLADDEDDGKPIRVRGIWDRITPTSCRWQQAVSRDGGVTWDDNWFMDWTRVPG